MKRKKRDAFLRLKALRVENGYTQLDMAKKLGISETSFILKENGHRSFSLEEAELIANIFKKTINETFFCA